jgi:alkanesulfonate monooxygenase SsuD/methylene tetrahydromethanopterin reductase-like flavin-dependent oxidoreductase (luciferase family)
MIATVLARTERVTVFPDVANLPLRPPAVMAKAAASLDVISGCRFELGLGAGAFWEAVGAMGGPARSPGEAVDALGEAIDVIRLMWFDQRSVRFDGRHYRLSGVKPGPQPAHDLGIWLGVRGRRTLALVGRTADGWVPSSPWAPPEKLPAFTAQIDDAAMAAGRDHATIRRIYNVFGPIRERGTDGFLQGTVEQWTDDVGGRARHRQLRVRTRRRPDPPDAGLRRRGGAGNPRSGRSRLPCARNGLSRNPPRRRCSSRTSPAGAGRYRGSVSGRRNPRIRRPAAPPMWMKRRTEYR